MLQIDIKPLIGIFIQNIGEVRLGQNRKEIDNIIGSPNKSDSVSIGDLIVSRAFYNRYELRIDFDKENYSEFIEFIYGPFSEKVLLSIYKVKPFELMADQLLEVLATYNSGPIDESEAPYSYAFKNISVGIWRDSYPSEILEIIDKKRQGNEYEMDNKWLNEELKKSEHFWTIGIGRKDYY